MEIFHSPLIIPLGAFVVAIVAIVSGIWSDAHTKRIRADQRMAMLARGMSIDDIETALQYVVSSDHGQQVSIFSSNPNADRYPGRSPRQSGLSGQHKLPVPARTRRVSVHRAQRLRGRYPVDYRCAAVVLDPLDDRGQTNC